MYYPFVRKALFQLDPERAYEFTFQRLRHTTGTLFEALVRQKAPVKSVNCINPTSKNPLGLAAGPDKDEECIDTLGTMGLGSIEIDTVTPCSQPGNDKPRLLRLVDAKGLINRMGFNNLGVDNLVENVKKAHYDGVSGTNIGRNKNAPVGQGRDDYLICMEKIYAYARYITISISPSNTPRLRTLQHGEALGGLLTAVKNKQSDSQATYHKYVSIAVKIMPDLSEEELIQIADSLVRHNIDGIITVNTTLDRSLTQGVKNCDQTGGLNGRPLRLESTEITCRLLPELNGRLPIIGVGGINSIIVTREKIAAGASLVRIYSGFIFKDPSLIKEIVTHI